MHRTSGFMLHSVDFSAVTLFFDFWLAPQYAEHQVLVERHKKQSFVGSKTRRRNAIRNRKSRIGSGDTTFHCTRTTIERPGSDGVFTWNEFSMTWIDLSWRSLHWVQFKRWYSTGLAKSETIARSDGSGVGRDGRVTKISSQVRIGEPVTRSEDVSYIIRHNNVLSDRG
jgi:hypothetical protein